MASLRRPLLREFARFVVPSVVAQWVFALYTMVDGMFVARGVGETALAAVNLSLPYVSFLFAISLVMAVGCSTVVSIHYGKKDTAAANRAYTQNLLVVLGISLLITGFTLAFLTPIARFLGADGDTIGYVESYIGTIACFSLPYMLAYYFEILIKADGKPRLATVMVTVGAVANCVLDYLFVFVIKWGVFGAAFATGLAQTMVAGFFLVYFLGSRAKLRLTRFRFAPGVTLRTLKLGLPSGITEFSSGISIFLFNQFILRYIGTDGIVSYTIVAYVNTILVMSMTGIAQGFQPLASYYHGKGEAERCTRLLKYGLVTAAGLSLAIGLPSWLGADFIVSIFVSPQHAGLRAYSAEVFRVFALSFLLVGYNIIFSGWFTAVERAAGAMVISLARGFVLIALALWLLTSLLGGSGIWWAPTLAEGACLLLTLGFALGYRRAGRRSPARQQV